MAETNAPGKAAAGKKEEAVDDVDESGNSPPPLGDSPRGPVDSPLVPVRSETLTVIGLAVHRVTASGPNMDLSMVPGSA